MDKRNRKVLEFGSFRLDIERRYLLQDGEIIPIPPKAFLLLQVLLQHSGKVVDKKDLLEIVWPDSMVEESNLSQTIYLLRKILHRKGGAETIIETLPKLGYRLTASVREITTDDEELSLAADAEIMFPSTVEVPAEEPDPGPPLEEGGIESTPQIASSPPAPLPKHTGTRVSTPQAGRPLTILRRIAEWVAQVAAQNPQQRHQWDLRSVGILPFSAFTRENSYSILGLQIADGLITRLSSLHRFQIPPTAAISRYAVIEPDIFSAGQELGVEAVLTGHTRHSGDFIRVTLQLVRIADRQLLWTASVDGAADRIFELEDKIAEQILEAIKK